MYQFVQKFVQRLALQHATLVRTRLHATMSYISFEPTCDLYDKYLDDARVVSVETSWIPYGKVQQFCGNAVTVKCFEDNSRIKELLEEETEFKNIDNSIDSAVQKIPSSTNNTNVLFVDGGGSRRCALLGDQIAKAACTSKVWAGIVIYGCVRDVDVLRTLDIGIVALGNTPRKSVRRNEGQVNIPITIGNVTIDPNSDYVFVDNDGIVVLRKDLLVAQTK